MTLPLTGGGNDMDTYCDFDDCDIDFRNKLIVWYRAIYNRPAEILGVVQLPKTHKEVRKTWGAKMNDIDHKYESIAQWIPEYQDLIKAKDLEESLEKRCEIIAKMMSFDVFTAIYCKKSNKVLTLRCSLPSGFFAELFNIERAKEVEHLIKEKLHNNHFYH